MAAEASFIIRAVDATRAAFASVQNTLQKTASMAANTGAAINKGLGGFGAALSVGGVIAFGKSIIDLGGYINDTARAAGLSTDAFQALGYAGRESGVGMEQMARAAEALRSKITDAASGNQEAIKTFQKLNLTAAELQAVSLDKAFEVIAKAIKSASNEQEAMNIASDIFGARIGPKMREVIDQLASGSIEKLGQDMKGLMLSKEQLASLDEAGDKLERLWTRVKVLGAELLLFSAKAGPILSKLSLPGAIQMMFGGAGGKGAGAAGAPTTPAGPPVTPPAVSELDAQTQAAMAQARSDAELLSRLKDDPRDPARRAAAAASGLKKQEDAFDALLAAQRKANDESDKARDKAKSEAEQVDQKAESYRKLADPFRVYSQQLTEVNKLEAEGLLTVKEARLAREAIGKDLEDFKLKNNEVAKSAKMVGDAFAGAFEDAIFSGEKLGDVLKALARDLVRLVFQQTITAPLAGAISSAIIAGFRADGGPVSSGSPYVVGEKGPELFVPRTSGSIVPNKSLGGSAAAGGVNITYNIAAGVTKAELVPILESERRRMKAEIPDMVRRGGAYRAAFA